MDKKEIMQIFEKTGALLTGHFQLASGLHSNQYFQCALVLQYPTYAEALGKEIGALFRDQGITCVIGLALGGIVIGYEVARALNVKGFFAERVNGEMQFRRGFEVSAHDKVLVVEDVITTGGSAQEVVKLLKSKCDLVGVASIIDRSTTPPSFGIAYRSLMKMEVKTFDSTNCPLCKEGKPFSKPGTKALVR